MSLSLISRPSFPVLELSVLGIDRTVLQIGVHARVIQNWPFVRIPAAFQDEAGHVETLADGGAKFWG